MKEEIIAALAKPYVDKYVVEVYRQIDRFHVPVIRTYSVRYTEPEKVYRLSRLFVRMNELIQKKILAERIETRRTNGTEEMSDM